MRYGGGRNGGLNVTLGDGWNIIFVGMGVMLTISCARPRSQRVTVCVWPGIAPHPVL